MSSDERRSLLLLLFVWASETLALVLRHASCPTPTLALDFLYGEYFWRPGRKRAAL